MEQKLIDPVMIYEVSLTIKKSMKNVTSFRNN